MLQDTNSRRPNMFEVQQTDYTLDFRNYADEWVFFKLDMIHSSQLLALRWNGVFLLKRRTQLQRDKTLTNYKKTK